MTARPALPFPLLAPPPGGLQFPHLSPFVHPVAMR